MKLLQLFVAWWNAEPVTQRQRVNAHKAVPSDHFDKFGNYIFKDKSIGRLAGVAKSLGATMAAALVQWGDSGVNIASGSSAAVMTGNATVGNTVVVNFFTHAGTETITGVSSAMGSFTLLQRATGFYYGDEWWICTNVTTAGAALTATTSAGGTWWAQATEYSGISGWTAAGGGTTSNITTNTVIVVPTNGVGQIAMSRVSTYDGTSITESGPMTAFTGTAFKVSNGVDTAYLITTTASGTNSLWNSGISAHWYLSCITIIPPAYTAPSAPTLSGPANASYQDVSAGITFAPITFNSTDAANQNAYAFRIKVSGGTYNYWNVGTSALQSTIVWNADSVVPGGTWSVTLPAGILTNGNAYNWSFASQEALANLQGPFASDFTFTAQAPPSVVVNSPTGSVATNAPVVSWTDTLAGGASQIDYQIKVESGPYGAAPGSGVLAWNSGVVASALISVTVGVALTPGVTYRAFVQITETGGQVSAWGYSTFTVAVDVPAVSAITATPTNDPVTGAPRVTLTVNANDNQLTANQSSLEGNVTTGWSAGANTTIAASSTWAQDGSYSLAMTATAAGAVVATIPVGVSGVPVIAGQTVRAMAYFHSPTTSRVCSVAIAFYNGATLLSTSTSTTVNSTTTGGATGAQAFISMAVPVNATFATLILNGAGLGASEVLNADSMLVAPGSSTTWTKGGFVGTTTVTITRSDGVLVRGAGWNGTAALPVSQMVTIYDYETIASHTYSATVSTVAGGLTLTSGAGVSAAAGVVLSSWDIMDPTNPASYTKLEWAGDTRTFDRVEAQAVLTAFNRATDITVRGQLLNPSFDMSLNFGGDNDAAWQAFDALRSMQRTVMVRGDMAGDIFYVNLGGARPLVTARTGDRVNNPSRSLVIKTAPADRP
jgi:hypothetical protein